MRKLSIFFVAALAVCSFLRPKPAEARLEINYPIWQVTVGTTSGLNPYTGVYTNVICAVDQWDRITVSFYTSTGANFYSTAQLVSTNAQFLYQTAEDQAFLTEARKMSPTAGISIGNSYMLGMLKVIFQDSGRANVHAINQATLTTATVDGVANTPVANDPIQAAMGTTSQVPVNSGNAAGCFVDIVAPNLSNSAFSVPESASAPLFR